MKPINFWLQPVTHNVYTQENQEITKYSLAALGKYRDELSPLRYVEIMAPYGLGNGEYLVRFIDSQGNYIQLDGLSWGYWGEGPHGLETAMQSFNLPYTIQEIGHMNSDHMIIDAGLNGAPIVWKH